MHKHLAHKSARKVPLATVVALTAGATVLLLFFVYSVLPLVGRWLEGFLSSLTTSGGSPSTLVSSAEGAVPGSFTELFSGTGWKNPKTSTAYQDTRLGVISETPAYMAQDAAPLSAALTNESVLAARGNGETILAAAQSGTLFLFGKDETMRAVPLENGSLLRNAAAGDAALAYDPGMRRWFAALVFPHALLLETLSFENGIALRTGYAEIPLEKLDVPARSEHQLSGAVCRADTCMFALDDAAFAVPLDNLSSPAPAPVPQKGKTASFGIAGDRFLLGITGYDGSRYYGDIYVSSSGNKWVPLVRGGAAHFFDSSYPGRLYFGLDGAKGAARAVYAAYVGQAAEFALAADGSLASSVDYSRFFPQRVMGGDREGDVKFVPELVADGSTWWAGPRGESGVPRLLRISQGLALDLSDRLLGGARTFTFAQGFASGQLYLFFPQGGGTRVERFNDEGFASGGTVVWESVRLNSWDGAITQGRVVKGEGEGTAKYFLSNNGGRDWVPAPVGQGVRFYGDGGDFRFRVELVPGEDHAVSPSVDTVTVEYSIVRAGQ